MCLTEHHLKDYEIDNLPIDHFKLGSKFCRHEFKNEGVCIFIHEDLDFFSISLDKYCKEKNIEVCAVRLKITPIQLIILAIYRSSSGLSDHEAQITIIENIVLTKQINNIITQRDINDQSILEFQLLLSHENWEEIFTEDDANISFNKFLNIYLRIFHSCFIKKCTDCNTISKPWIIKGIKTSCNRKRELYLKVRDNNEMEHKLYYKHYCKMLSKVIKEVKKLYYKEVITK